MVGIGKRRGRAEGFAANLLQKQRNGRGVGAAGAAGPADSQRLQGRGFTADPTEDGALGEASCIDAARLADVAQCPATAPTDGNRPGCRCARSRDIGAYDTCPHGCVSCYAVKDRDRAVANFRVHDPAAATLRG